MLVGEKDDSLNLAMKAMTGWVGGCTDSGLGTLREFLHWPKGLGTVGCPRPALGRLQDLWNLDAGFGVCAIEGDRGHRGAVRSSAPRPECLPA